jgi:hypothetical protein
MGNVFDPFGSSESDDEVGQGIGPEHRDPMECQRVIICRRESNPHRAGSLVPGFPGQFSDPRIIGAEGISQMNDGTAEPILQP